MIMAAGAAKAASQIRKGAEIMDKRKIEKRVYPIAADAVEEVGAKLAKVAAKAAKYGCEMRYGFGDEYMFKVTYWDDSTIPARKIGVQTVAAVDCTVESEIVCKGDYTVIAQIEHMDGGNVVRMFNGEDTPGAWFQAKSKCDHCGTMRNRTHTYMVVDMDTGEFMQIGKSCLKDYTGIDPSWIAINAELSESLTLREIESMKYGDEESFNAACSTAFDPVEVVARAIERITEEGYRRASEYNSTKERVLRDIEDHTEMKNEEESMARAREIKEWLAGVSHEQFVNDERLIDSPLRSCKAIMAGSVCGYKHFGFLVYAPIAYEKELERERKRMKREEERAYDAARSQHVGEEGQHIEIAVTECKLITSWETNYGMTYLYKMVDEAGNVFVWFASRRIVNGFEAGTVKATVKGHTERDGVKQTVITRCKVCA